ncbi:MAG: hypothetical protein A2103_01035 [Gammaproteobacteria bacterium GWF2_41_13]|nr:MAG: hypothetical protein A2103_01035 [Gammaproteobacteria bacterium GWF2_41_13]
MSIIKDEKDLSVIPLQVDQYVRYSRHLLLPEIGAIGQERLYHAKVLLIGVGGLGSPAATYLAAAGVGTMGLVEFDEVDLSNLQRQTLYTTAQIGLPKIVTAIKRLKSINPHITIVQHDEPLMASNALKILHDYDYILDATDNLATRYLINDACVLLKKMYVFGSVYNFEGRVSIFGAPNSPCYRCIFPKPGILKNTLGGLDLGVLGVVPGVIGTIQATEVIKLVCNIGQPLIGKILLYEALAMKFREMKVAKNPNCPICGLNRTITDLSDYEKNYNFMSKGEKAKINKISAFALNEIFKIQPNYFLLDCREDSELSLGSIENSFRIPINNLRERLNEIDQYKNKFVIIYCQSGQMSLIAAKELYEKGFDNVSVLNGGLFAWLAEGFPIKHNNNGRN